MKHKNTLIEGAFITTLSIIVTKVLGLLYVISFYKIIGNYGGVLYSYAYNIYNVFLSIGSAGIPKSISKIISEYDALHKNDEKREIYYISKNIVGIFSIISFLIMFICAPYLARKLSTDIESVTLVIRCISFSILIIPSLSIMKGYFEGHKIMGPSSVSNVIEQLIRITIIILGSFISYKIFHIDVSYAVGISLFGAFIGGLMSTHYINKKASIYENTLRLTEKRNKSINKKILIKKIIKYSIPFILVSITHSIYNFTDMVLTIKGLHLIKHNDIDYIVSIITTWSSKICSIPSAFALGLVASLIPTITVLFTEKKWGRIEATMNKSYEIILFITIPIAINISLLSHSIWSLFYTDSIYGTKILSSMIISTILSNIYTITINIMEVLNRYKIVYKSVLSGLFINAIFDIPLIIIFKLIHIPPYLGPILSSMIGYTISIYIAIKDLKVRNYFTFKRTIITLMIIIFITSISIIPHFILNRLFVFNTSKLLSIIEIFIKSIISGIIYLYLSYKLKLIKRIFSGK